LILEALPTWFSRFYLFSVHVYPLNGATLLALSALLPMIVFVGAVSSAEMVFFSLNETALQKIKLSKNKAIPTYFSLLDQPKKLFFTFSVANILGNTGIVVLSAYIIKSIFFFSPIFFNLLFQLACITFFVLFFGKIMPRLIASNRYERHIGYSSALMHALFRLFSPLTWLLMKISFVVRDFFNAPANISLNDLSHAIEITSSNVADERKLLKSILRFGNTESREIMRSRLDIVAVEQCESFENLLNIISDKGYSRMPVYEQTLDKILGILYSKDLIPLLDKPSDFQWLHLIRPPYFVPETKKIDDLLEDFQLKKIHLAVVIDEFGGTSGIVTLEDILEEVVGEMHDGHQKQSNANYIKIDDQNFIFEGKTLLNDFYRIVECPDTLFKDEKGDADTLAGLILEIMGEIPARNSVVSCRGYEFRIIQSDNRRIKKIKIKLPNTK